jgi:hypothetical protein
VAILLALHAAGAGFRGDPLAVVRDAAPDSRLWEIPDRRGPVIGVTLLVWLAAFAVAMTAERFLPRSGVPFPGYMSKRHSGRLSPRSAVPFPGYVSKRHSGKVGARVLPLALVYLPLLCLAGAAVEPSVGVERVLVMLGSPLLAALTLRACGGYRALAVACVATALAHAIDLIAGSPLTQLSLAGPSPIGGHRFYGIGNELEAILVVLILVGTGAALSAPLCLMRSRSTKGTPEGVWTWRGPAAFLVVAAVFSFVFAYGRYGADVGAAITLPLGAAVAAALLAGRRRLALLAFAIPLPALAILSAADLLTGANAHLTRTVLDAESGGDVLAVVGHRLREAGESFGRPILLAGLPVAIAAAVLAWRGRARIAAWLRGLPAMRAGMLGALAATVVGTLANDSGALLLEIGGLYLLAFLAYIWAESDRPDEARRIDYA